MDKEFRDALINTRETVRNALGDDYEETIAPVRELLENRAEAAKKTLDELNSHMKGFGFSEKLGFFHPDLDGNMAFAVDHALDSLPDSNVTRLLVFSALADLTL